MIAIISGGARERTAFGAMCEAQGWPYLECESVGNFSRILRHTTPRVVLVRHKLGAAYSDEVIGLLAAAGGLSATKIIVLMGAGEPAAAEARQLVLGADCVLRDPVRADVLRAYLEKYHNGSSTCRVPAKITRDKSVPFAGATLWPLERTLRRGTRAVRLTPREVQLIELLAQSQGDVVSYETLYGELLGRRFRGDTSNMRVLLGKLARSVANIGVRVRDWIEVIPKLGYRYHESPRSR